jgi:mRNA-degrading endonuclease toxin of MazEF toxin-antitoxin module
MKRGEVWWIVSKSRLLNRAGRLTDADMKKVEAAIKIQLDLTP